MKNIILFAGLLFCSVSYAQEAGARLSAAFTAFEGDAQFKHALISLYVVDSKTGKPVFEKNTQIGLAPASCLKVVTSATAFELLGKDYRYKTDFGFDGVIDADMLKGNLFLIPSGDPTLGSWRWESSKIETLQNKFLAALNAENIRTISGDFIIDDSRWETQATPNGWTWEDIGNYYGAGARGLNWHENQYDLFLKSGKNIGDSVDIIETKPVLRIVAMLNELKTGSKGSGDNSIIYLPENGSVAFLRGTIPAGNDRFKISGSLPNPKKTFKYSILNFLFKKDIEMDNWFITERSVIKKPESLSSKAKTIVTHYSPTLDSINYWFMQKSVNLYGEALVKTIAYEKTNFGATDTGLNIIKDFWSKKEIDKSALNIKDGSGLSPANRLTGHALVTILQYARQQNWYPSFYNALPELNGIKMKSGYIGGVRSYTGYIKSKSGTEYTFSFIINNFEGSPGSVREKMWKILDILK